MSHRAADIVERHRTSELGQGRLDVVARWLALLPAATRKERPKLLLTEGMVALFRGDQLERLAVLIERVDALVEEGHPDELELAGEVAFFKGYLLYWDGQGESSSRFFEEALEQLDGTQLFIRRLVEAHLALARSLTGQEEQAIRGLEDRLASLDRSEVRVRLSSNGLR